MCGCRKKISLIIPVYNTELYLKQCLESAINQTYDNIEIICIDDGSTDNSGAIIDEFCKKDNRIVVIHQENHGESNARNQGLKIATGDYIAFMDCDDWIEPQMYETLVKVMEKNDVDVVASSWCKDIGDRSIRICNRLIPSLDKISGRQLMEYVYRRDDYQGFAYMWNKLYKRHLIYSGGNNSPILFDESLELGGDVLFLAEVLLNVNDAIYIDDAFYHYRQRTESGCHTENINKRLDWLKAYEITIDKFERERMESDILIWVKRFMAYHASNAAEIAHSQDKKRELQVCQGIMKKYHKEYISTNGMYPDRVTRYNKIESLTII